MLALICNDFVIFFFLNFLIFLRRFYTTISIVKLSNKPRLVHGILDIVDVQQRSQVITKD